MTATKPIVIAHHLIWTAYGTWPPNDIRGSTSKTLRNPILHEIGEMHYGRKRAQPSGKEIRAFKSGIKSVLKFPVEDFTRSQIELIGESFAEVIAREKYTCYACAILPDHAHLVIRKHKHQAEEIIEQFQQSSRSRLRATDGFTANHPVWGGRGWKVFLDHPKEVRRTMVYIERNPIPFRMPRQIWSFITEYDNWPLHEGHNPNSPYVKRLKACGKYP